MIKITDAIKLSGKAKDKRQLYNFPIYHITSCQKYQMKLQCWSCCFSICNLIYTVAASQIAMTILEGSPETSVKCLAAPRKTRNNATVRKRQDTLQHSKNPCCFYILHICSHFHHCSPPLEIPGSIRKGDKTRFRTEST